LFVSLCRAARGGRKFKASGSFLKKRTKKLFLLGVRVNPARAPIRKSFCFFFQKEALS
jgi:hypothetical protein